MLKKAYVSPAQPRHAKTCLSQVRPQPQVTPQAYPWGTLKMLAEPRTKLGKERVLARLGLGGWNSAFFSILLERTYAD
jgi:hypothetical protein